MFVFHHCLINLTVRNSGSSKQHYQYLRQFSNLISQCGRETRQLWNVFISWAQDFYNCFSFWLSLKIPPCFSIQTVNTSFDFLDFLNKKINNNDSYMFHYNEVYFWGRCKHCAIHLHEIRCDWENDYVPDTTIPSPPPSQGLVCLWLFLGSTDWV